MKKIKQAKKEFNKIMVPRVLAAIMVVLLYLFVGEVFSESFQWSNLLLALIPGSVYLVITKVAWKRARLGGMLFVVLGIGLVFLNVAHGRNDLGPYILAIITFGFGFLFIKLGEIKK